MRISGFGCAARRSPGVAGGSALFALQNFSYQPLVGVQLFQQLAHGPVHLGHLLGAVVPGKAKGGLELFQGEGGCVAHGGQAHRAQEGVDLRVVGHAHHGYLHHGGIDERMQPYAHKQVHVADDAQHLIGQVLFPDAPGPALQSPLQLLGHGQVLGVVEGDQHAVGPVFLRKPADAFFDFRHKGGV